MKNVTSLLVAANQADRLWYADDGQPGIYDITITSDPAVIRLYYKCGFAVGKVNAIEFTMSDEYKAAGLTIESELGQYMTNQKITLGGGVDFDDPAFKDAYIKVRAVAVKRHTY